MLRRVFERECVGSTECEENVYIKEDWMLILMLLEEREREREREIWEDFILLHLSSVV